MPFIKYKSELRSEICSRYNDLVNFSKVIGEPGQRSNINRALSETSNACISKKLFETICKKINIAPFCFVDSKIHDAIYNDSYKMTYDTYKSIKESQDVLKKANPDYVDLMDHTMKLWIGLSDNELSVIPKKVKKELWLRISELMMNALIDLKPKLK